MGDRPPPDRHPSDRPPPDSPKFRFFFHLPPQFSFFLLSLGGPFVEFWWCLKRRGPEMCASGVLGLSCEAPAALKLCTSISVPPPQPHVFHQSGNTSCAPSYDLQEKCKYRPCGNPQSCWCRSSSRNWSFLQTTNPVFSCCQIRAIQSIHEQAFEMIRFVFRPIVEVLLNGLPTSRRCPSQAWFNS